MTSTTGTKTAVSASELPVRVKSVYPEPFASMMKGREKTALGDYFGITKFGVNLTRLTSGSRSALLHKHTEQQEFIFILEGAPTLVTDQGEIQLKPGMCAGFMPDGVAHYLVNKSNQDAVYLEVGDRDAHDRVSYPEDDIAGVFHDGAWKFTHKNGAPY